MPLRRIVMPTQGQLMGIGLKARAAEGRAADLSQGLSRLGAGFRAGAESAKQSRQFDDRMAQQESQFSRGLALRRDEFDYTKLSDERAFGLREQRFALDASKVAADNWATAANLAFRQRQEAGVELAERQQLTDDPNDPAIVALRTAYDKANEAYNSAQSGLSSALSSGRGLISNSLAPTETIGGAPCSGPT
jgi:hypothetical protein